MMQEDLTLFLAKGTRLCEISVSWGAGTLPLKVAYYCSNEPPPLRYVSSVRAIVFKDDSVLVVTQPNGQKYILPGGRREPGESLLQTLQREVLEETGWTLYQTKLLGFMYLHHLGYKPQNYQYPFPDFLWPVYSAEAGDFTAWAIIPDKYVSESGFRPIKEVKNLGVQMGELLLLEEARKLKR